MPAMPEDLPAAFLAWTLSEGAAFSIGRDGRDYVFTAAMFLDDGTKLTASRKFEPELDRGDLYSQLDELREHTREELRDMACHRIYGDGQKERRR